jgi:F-type H+-transporting ATPase subunit delta
MNTSRISVRYARALFETAMDQKKVERINSDMLLLIESIKINEFKIFLENPVIFPSKKLALFNSIFQDKLDALTIDFFKLLTRNKRELYLSAIARNFRRMAGEFLGIKAVDLVTAFSPDVKLVQNISDIISTIFKAKVEITEKIDPEIIGGFIVTVEGLQYDASISTKLNNIKKDLIGTHTS